MQALFEFVRVEVLEELSSVSGLAYVEVVVVTCETHRQVFAVCLDCALCFSLKVSSEGFQYFGRSTYLQVIDIDDEDDVLFEEEAWLSVMGCQTKVCKVPCD